MGIFLSLLAGLLPMLFFAWIVYWIDRFEKEPKILLGIVFIWGAVIAAGTAFVINTILGMGVYFITGSEAATDLTTGALIAPVVEESLKGLAVLLVFLIFRTEFDSILDGIVYASIVALGFAATENAYYIYKFGYSENGIQGLLWIGRRAGIDGRMAAPILYSFYGYWAGSSTLEPKPGNQIDRPIDRVGHRRFRTLHPQYTGQHSLRHRGAGFGHHPGLDRLVLHALVHFLGYFARTTMGSGTIERGSSPGIAHTGTISYGLFCMVAEQRPTGSFLAW